MYGVWDFLAFERVAHGKLIPNDIPENSISILFSPLTNPTCIILVNYFPKNAFNHILVFIDCLLVHMCD